MVWIVRASFLTLLAAVMIMTASNDVSAQSDGFSIYLATETPCEALDKNPRAIGIENEPIISSDDIVAYYKDTHEIALTPSAYDRFMPDHWGGHFVVCVGTEPIYAGAFWSRLSSVSYHGVVVLIPSLYQPLGSGSHTIRLELGYPSEMWFKGTDPRSDLRILRALEKAGKLKKNPNGFSIYLPADDLNAVQVSEKNLASIRLQNKPIVSGDDIIAYNRDTHEILLTSPAYNRVINLDAGTPFVVCIGRDRIYAGFIWSSTLSGSPVGVFIDKDTPEPAGDGYTVRLGFGLSSDERSAGTDIRSDSTILSALVKAGKLRQGGLTTWSEFSIYLSTDEVPDCQLDGRDIRKIKLEGKPIIAHDDIVAYNMDKHEITLTSSAYDRFMQVPAATKFVVCLGAYRMYQGVIWRDDLSSQCDCVVVLKPSRDSPERGKHTIRLRLGYPTEKDFFEEDWRSSPQILRVLEKAGKLGENLYGFSIKLPDDRMSIETTSKIKHRKIRLQDEAILYSEDILAYYKDTHEITLTPSAHSRLMNLDARTPFVVCVGTEPIYAGTIWSSSLSEAPGGVFIDKDHQNPWYVHYTVQLELGQPAGEDSKKADLRSDSRILGALEKASKLRK